MIDISILKTLEPISTLSPNRMQELATLCFREKVSKGIDPFRMNVLKNAQALYLLKGQLELRYIDGKVTRVIDSNSLTRYPIDSCTQDLKEIVALSDIEILRIDTDLLDIMMTWDQLASIDGNHQKHQTLLPKEIGHANRWMNDTNTFSAAKLQSGIFSRLPPANIEEMFRRMTLLHVKTGQVVIQQGTQGDFFYLIESGIAIVSRYAGSLEVSHLAELTAGDSFGEEALASDSKRNATIIMKTDGVLLRLSKQDFIELLQKPLLVKISMQDAEQAVKEGAIWLDVRLPTEYAHQHIPGAINAPLHNLRNLIGQLNKEALYIVYCRTGRRSSAAAIILLGYGFNVRTIS